ncbi:Maf-like protein YceF [Marinobacterium zhoushanense]|uniref:7-methyl-GTP pyrophosphatase n=1 Tax=Marinobacterium zhoushanense TaxID=1679163 RepID=A0ABQ1KDY1_9GAMM|nr:nucleoside triphosphate pyrophosphatase [Marinobacterium zhoushanense]GGB92977.1 Maf-like protein YceF [Marinobacterium zhoushanense]
MSRPLVLASGSAYRRALLDKLGVDYSCDSPDIDETRRDDENAEELVARLALEKAQAVAARNPNALIIGSDQVATLDDHILGKPLTHERASAQLKLASGRTVRFLTGLCLLDAASEQFQLEVVPFDVEFRQLRDSQIENYLQREQPYDCAGSFKSEGLGIALFQRLTGEDPNSLVGLPLICLIQMLEREGIDVLRGE